MNLPPDERRRLSRLMTVGIEYAAVVAVFGFIGAWVDSRWGTKPWGVVVGAALGLVGATYNLIRESMAAFKDVSNRFEPGRANSTDEESKSPQTDDSPSQHDD